METIKKKTYFWIFGWLMVLTVFEIYVAKMPLEQTPLVIFLVGTALAKASLIVLYFMHMRYENGLVWLLPIIPIALSIFFVLMLFPDMVYHLPLNFQT